MRLLAITTSTARCGVALLDGSTLVASRTVDNDRLHAEKLFSLIDAALAETGWRKDALGAVACDRGPGSFTGVRIGLASAKGIAIGLGVAVAGVGSLEAMAAAAFACDPTELVMPMIDAKRGERFVAMHARDSVRMSAGHLPVAAVRDLLARQGPPLCLCGEAARGFGDSARLIDHPSCELPAAEWIGRAALTRLEARGDEDLEPVYLRPPDATLPACPPDWRVG